MFFCSSLAYIYTKIYIFALIDNIDIMTIMATITSIENGCIYVYDKFPLPLHYRGKFYAVGRMTDGHKVLFLGKRKFYLLMRFVEAFRKIARIPEFEKEV